ncbi:SPASM domain-containing protein [bacterium]|nr:SPASM domain-containing protein [bacterium]
MLWIEPSSACNLDCPDCPTANGRGGGVMQLDRFTEVLDQLPWVKILNLWHRGEPLLAPDFPDMAAEASSRNIWTQTYTNGTLLAKGNLAEEIVRSGLKRITIGVDGPDETTYSRIRHGGSLADVEAGVRALVSARKKSGSRKPKIVVECLLSRQTSEQFRNTYNKALSWGCDRVLFKTYRISDLGNPDYITSSLPDNPELWRYKRVNGHLEMNRRRSTCRRLSYSAVVTWKGEVLPCCFSTNEFHSFGNVFQQPWKEIWTGKAFKQFLNVLNNGGRDRIPMCRNCTEGLKRLYLPRKLVCR